MNPILYRYKDTEAVIKVMDGYTPGDGWSPLYGPDEVKAATNAALERAERVPKPFPHEDMDKVALARYTVAKSKSTIWPCSVVAGDGEQELFSGSESTCKHVARKLTGAFLDGAFYAQAQPERKPMTEAEIAEVVREASKGSATRRDGTTSTRIVRAVEAFHGIGEKP